VTPFKFGVDYDYDHYEKLIPALAKADILFLCHGSKHDNAQQANCDSFVALIELFKQQHGRGLIPKEVWAVGSEIECHPCFGIKKLYPYANSKRHFAKHARAYFHSDDIQYRHIVHSAFNSPMGPGLMSARFAAKVTLFLLKRGFKYVPVTYTGFAFMNYFRYAFKQRAIGLRT
jgi:monoglucosyldiacylglycerol epimerase